MIYQVTLLIDSNKHPGTILQNAVNILEKRGAKIREAAISDKVEPERFDGMTGRDEGEEVSPDVQRIQPYSDSDPMPFGKHKGKPMGQVPAQYLDWVSGEEWLTKWPRLEAYIVSNRAQIDAELEDE